MYFPPFTVRVPPPLSLLIGADEFPSVSAVTFLAVKVPPPVTMMAPELLLVVLISVFDILIVPFEYANTPFACEPLVITLPPLIFKVPSFTKTAAFVP